MSHQESPWSKWPDHLVEGLRTLLKGGVALPSLEAAFEIVRAKPHGHVAAVLGTLKRLGLERLFDRTPSPQRALAVAMIAARILQPRSKLATARGLTTETANHTFAEELGAEDASADNLHDAMDWLLQRQRKIERGLAKRHLEEGSLVLCDLTSVYLEGGKCTLARHGYSRDKKRGKLQIVFALFCNRDGCPVAVEVFEGNTGASLPSSSTTNARPTTARPPSYPHGNRTPRSSRPTPAAPTTDSPCTASRHSSKTSPR